MAQPLSNLLILLNNLPGVNNVYYQPPEDVKMQYPCILIELDGVDAKYASNSPYMINLKYKLSLISYDDGASTLMSMLELPMCSFDRHYVEDSLNHNVCSVYY